MSIPIGVTPTFTLTFDDENLDLTAANHVYVTFKSSSNAVLTKTDSDITVEAKAINVYLSQDETLALKKGSVFIQANWTYGNGSRAASEAVRYSFTDNLLDRVVE